MAGESVKTVSTLLASVLGTCAVAALAGEKPANAPAMPVTETLWGQKVTDNYRYMEQAGPATLAWMKAEGAYTRSVLDSIKSRSLLGQQVDAFTASFGLVESYARYGQRAFYQERAPGSDNFDLMVKDAGGVRKIVDIGAIRAAHGNEPYAINYILAAPDGSKVAVGISKGGSEDASISVYDARSGRRIAGPIDRAQFGATAWSEDSQWLYFNRLQKLAPGEGGTDKYKDSTADAWSLHGDPIVVAGRGVGRGTSFDPDEMPFISIVPGTPVALLASINGVQNEMKVWTAPVSEAARPNAHWTLLFDRDADIDSVDQRGDEIFLRSHKDAPTFKVLVVKAGEPLSAARVLVPASPNRVIENINAAADGLYVLACRGAYSELLRVPAGSDRIEHVPLPTRGHITEAFSDPRQPGIAVNFSSWVLPAQEYQYEPATHTFANLGIGTRGEIDGSKYIVSDLEARAHDGARVPLSLIQPKGKPKPQIVMLEAYGSYGISELADFSPRRAAAMREGITYGVCHVRGGGELGEAWRLGGKDANKHNTWQDLIACGEDLIGRGITDRQHLFIIGGSAGGITMGRAMTERPDLFAGVIDVVPDANTLRAEFSPNGPPNIPEFGTVTTEQGFKNLYEMDSVQHVVKGTHYPAVMISTGLNDPRVSPWEPAKFAAALDAADTGNPVLLRVDAEAGHGIGSTKKQTDDLTADWIAFVFWRSGLPDWQPAE